MRRETILTDGIRVTRDEAVELCLHHLNLAAKFFEASPDDNNEQINREAERILRDPDLPDFDTPELVAARAWLKVIHAQYEIMKDGR